MLRIPSGKNGKILMNKIVGKNSSRAEGDPLLKLFIVIVEDFFH
jgi:hypothetical protein